jgi:hypothetical protein
MRTRIGLLSLGLGLFPKGKKMEVNTLQHLHKIVICDSLH